MRSPFKFLDAYTLADKDAFFGRDQETDDLYRMVFKTQLLLIYGISGTGKTSLIQCGLASRFDGPDWFPIFIRRQNNINESLRQALNTALNGETQETLVEDVSYLYRFYLRPVYLIFDQFEELFILGSREEKLQFIQDLKALLATKLPCKIILTMREEYIGQLYDFEKVIPTLFDFRLRLEPMNNLKVKGVLEQSFQRFNIFAETPEEERFEQILDNLSAGKSGIQLPYLQVYLDMFYREDFTREYAREREGEELPPLTFTKDEIQNFGRIENVLEKFLREQELNIQTQLLQTFPDISTQAIRQVLDAFVTEEGTKRPVRFRRQGANLVLDEKVQELLPELPAAALTQGLEALERSRIVRFTGENIELAHDSLADLIDKQRSDQQRQLNEIKRRIQYSFDEFQKSGDYLSRRQLTAFEEFIPKIRLESDVKNYIEESRRNVETQERTELDRQQRELQLTQEKLATEQRATRRQRIYLILVGIVALIAFGLGFWAYQQNGRFKKQVLETVKSDVNALRNQGKYQEAITRIIETRKLFTSNGESSLLVLDTQLTSLQQITDLNIVADSIFAIPDSVPINDVTRIERLQNAKIKYVQADSLYSDVNTRNRLVQINQAIDKLFEFYLERANGMLETGNCAYARPILCSAQALKPDQTEVLNGFKQCGTEPTECAPPPR